MRATIHCQECRHLNRLERAIYAPETLRIICHGCEAPLKVVIPAESLNKPVKNPLALHIQ
jgi:hypothetical protein